MELIGLLLLGLLYWGLISAFELAPHPGMVGLIATAGWMLLTSILSYYLSSSIYQQDQQWVWFVMLEVFFSVIALFLIWIPVAIALNNRDSRNK